VVYYNQGKGNNLKKEDKNMVEVTGIEKLAHIIEADNKVRELNKKAKQRRIADLIAQGVDKEIAKVMASVGL
jgi:flagellar motility protein MotE (MotC chaperone)